MAITSEELTLFSEFIHRHTGIVLDSSKAYLLESRLGPMLVEAGADNFTDFFYGGYRSPEWVSRVVDAISTNETSFFRDKRPFELLQHKVLPDFFNRQQNRIPPGTSLHIWSAACSTGQEAYSLAMTIAELLGQRMSDRRITITGTDISELAIKKARAGVYSHYEVDRGVPSALRARYFKPNGEGLKVREDLLAMTEFKKMNLLDPAAGNTLYDIVLCRNVAIYFNQENRCRLFARIANCMRPNGILIIGSTETLLGVTDRFTREEGCNTVYFRNNSGA